MADGTLAADLLLLHGQQAWVSGALAEVCWRYGDTFAHRRVFGIRSPLGTGKTAGLVDILQSTSKVIYLAPRVSLVEQAAVRLGLRSYAEAPMGQDREAVLRGWSRLAINALSIHHLQQRDVSETVLVVDELSLVRRGLLNDARLSPARRRALWLVFLRLLREAQQVIVLDAHLEAEDLLDLSRLYGGNTNELALLYNQPPQDRGVAHVCGRVALIARALAAAQQAPVFFLGTSAKEAQRVAELGRQRGLKSLCLTAEDTQTEAGAAWLRAPQARPETTYQLVCATHTVGTGFSLDLREGRPLFPVVCIDARLLPGMDVLDLLQLFGRVRGNPALWYSFRGRPVLGPSFEDALGRLKMEQFRRLRERFHLGVPTHLDVALLRGWLQPEARRRQRSWQALEGFGAMLQSEGYVLAKASQQAEDLRVLGCSERGLRQQLAAAGEGIAAQARCEMWAAPLPPTVQDTNSLHAWGAATHRQRDQGRRLQAALDASGLHALPMLDSVEAEPVKWVLEHGEAPLNLSQWTLWPDWAEQQDVLNLEKGASPLDALDTGLLGRVIREILCAMGVVPMDLLQATTALPIHASDEAWRLMQVHRSLLAEYLGIRAPSRPAYLMRSARTLFRRLGVEVLRHRSRSDQPRCYAARWPEVLRQVLLRKATSFNGRGLDAASLTETCGTSIVESVERALERRGPLYLHPGAPEELSTHHVNLQRQLRQCIKGVNEQQIAAPMIARDWYRESSGRIHMVGPSLQQVPSTLRAWFSAEAGRVLLDVDMRAAHLRIAAVLSGDENLMNDVQNGDIYARAGQALGVSRENAKQKLLTALNGGGGRAARWLLKNYPKLAVLQAEITQQWQQNPKVQFLSLAGRSVVIPTSHRGVNGWRTALSARWLAAEADLTNWVLARLHGRVAAMGGRLVLPMFDGLLLDAPIEAAEAVGREVVALFHEAGLALGVPVEAKLRRGGRWKM